jgi:hypothetical protein
MAPGSSTVRTGIDPKELRALRKRLKEREDGKAWTKALGAGSKAAGEIIVAESRSRLAGYVGHRKAARVGRQIKARASGLGIRIGVSNSSRVPYALATIWGTKKRTGWYARRRFEDSDGVQHEDWVGAGWKAGEVGEGPYGINSAIHAKRDEAIALWAEKVEQLLGELGD